MLGSLLANSLACSVDCGLEGFEMLNLLLKEKKKLGENLDQTDSFGLS